MKAPAEPRRIIRIDLVFKPQDYRNNSEMHWNNDGDCHRPIITEDGERFYLQTPERPFDDKRTEVRVINKSALREWTVQYAEEPAK